MNLVRRVGVVCFVAACGVVAACSDDSGSSVNADGGDGGSHDATSETSSPPDGTGGEASEAASSDTGADTTFSDAGSIDTGIDVPSADAQDGSAAEAEIDVGIDTTQAASDGAADATQSATDAGTEAAAEGGPSTVTDAAADVTLDAGQEAGLDGASDALVSATDVVSDASTDSPVAPPSLCPGSTFLFCDGFEQDILTDWTDLTTVNGEARRDSVHVYRGQYALHMTTYPVTEAGTFGCSRVQKYGSNPYPTHFFTRMFYYMPSPVPTSQFFMAELLQNGDPYSLLELHVTNGLFGELTWATTDGSTNQGWETDAGLPLDQWVCIEIEVDTIAETQHVYLNDTEVTPLARGDLALPQLGNVQLGLSFGNPAPQPTVEAWMDEVVIDTARVGCGN
jgi:hypothetical protein